MSNKHETLKPEEDNKRPGYYGGPEDTYEVVKVIKAWDLNFNLGNVLKYTRRAGKKSPDLLKDLTKARTYLDIEINYLLSHQKEKA